MRRGLLPPRVVVVIAVHNRLRYTKKVLDSLSKQSHKKLTVVVVDGGSNDGTRKFIETFYPEHKYIRGGSSWWWTRSVAEGVEEALKLTVDGDFILTMNNDCYFGGEYVASIVKASVNKKRAIIGSLILDSKNSTKVIDAGVRIDWPKALIYGVSSTVSNQLSFYRKRPYISKIDTLPGKGTLVPREVFKKVGNFNYERLPHYIADYEFFIRAKNSGFRLLVSTKSRLYNFVSATGITHVRSSRIGYAKAVRVLFGRKSRLNIADHINFLLLSCPRKYLPKNLAVVLRKTLNYLFRVFPFYYLGPAYSKLRLAIHNFPIYISQTYERVEIFLIDRNWLKGK